MATTGARHRSATQKKDTQKRALKASAHLRKVGEGLEREIPARSSAHDKFRMCGSELITVGGVDGKQILVGWQMVGEKGSRRITVKLRVYHIEQ